MRRPLVVLLALLGVVLPASPATSRTLDVNPSRTPHTLVVACAFSKGGDGLYSGFYVSKYPATTIHTVTLGYLGSYRHGDGTYTVTVTARKWTYDGALLGRATETFHIPSDERTVTKVTFDFGDVRVRQGSRITFTQHSPDAPVRFFYSVGYGRLGDESYDGCPGITETNGTRPPLSSFRRASVGVAIRAAR